MKKLTALLCLVLALVSLSASMADADTETPLWPAYDPVTGLWGYITEDGAWGIEPQWERAYHFHGGCAIVDTMDVPSWEGESTQGIIDETGAYLLEPEYSIDDACCMYGAGELYLVNRYDDERESGWFNIPNRYFSGLRWTECYATKDTPYIQINNDYAVSGLADRATGEVVLPMEYTYSGLFDQGIENDFIVVPRINTDGCELIEIGWGPVELPEGVYLDYAVGVSDRLVVFRAEDGLYGYINTEGEIVIPAQFDAAYDFRDGYAEVGLLEEVRTSSIIDRDGNVVISGLDVYYGMVADALFVKWPDGTWGLVETDGTIRCRHTPPEEAYILWLHEFTQDGPLWVEYALSDWEYTWGLMSREGELLGEPQWTQVFCRQPEEPWVTVCEGGFWDWADYVGTWGYADAYGNIVLPVRYAEAELFRGALARVRFDASTEGYINRSGEVVYSWPMPEGR
ncbi:MAG: WG repeat-containing protein [Clostridia bacterium]|nr:WG repeat-containing protein [Clostridia bacterium]